MIIRFTDKLNSLEVQARERELTYKERRKQSKLNEWRRNYTKEG